MRTIIITFITIISFSAIAQEMNYNWQFEVVNNTYTPIQNGISVNNGEIWDDPEYIIPIGFTFKFGQYECTELKFVEDLLGGGLVFIPNNQVFDPDNELGPLVLPMGADMCDRGCTDWISSESPLTYLVEGNVGSRIFKLQFENVGFYEETDNNNTRTSISYMNYQLWLYEGSGIFEFRYGSSYIDDFSLCFNDIYGPKIGFCYLAYLEEGDPIRHLLLLDGNSSAPDTVMIDTVFVSELYEDIVTALSSVPDSGTVYSFQINDNLSISKTNLSNISIFPNPGTDYLNLTLYTDYNNSQFYLYDMSGRLVLQENIKQKHTRILTALLSPGAYSYSIVNKGKVINSGKWVKK